MDDGKVNAMSPSAIAAVGRAFDQAEKDDVDPQDLVAEARSVLGSFERLDARAHKRNCVRVGRRFRRFAR